MYNKLKNDMYELLSDKSHRIEGIKYYCDVPIHVIPLVDAMEVMVETIERTVKILRRESLNMK